MTINTAVIGYGYAARTFHLPFLDWHPAFRVTALASSQKEKLAAQRPDVRCFADNAQMLADDSIELVVITAPNDLHFSLARACLERGKHVVVEKPFVVDVAQGEALIELADRKGCVLTVYQNRRWDGDFLTLQQLLAEQRLGQVKVFHSHFDRFRPQIRQRWRELPGEGSGILYDLGSHLVDQTLQLFGMPDSLTARCRSLRGNESACDYFHLMLHYSDKEVVLNSSPYCAHTTPRFHLQGTQGDYVKTGLDSQEAALKQGLSPASANWAEVTRECDGIFSDANGSHAIATQSGQYQIFYQQLADAIANKSASPVSAEQALQGIRVLQLAQQSSAQMTTLKL